MSPGMPTRTRGSVRHKSEILVFSGSSLARERTISSWLGPRRSAASFGVHWADATAPYRDRPRRGRDSCLSAAKALHGLRSERILLLTDQTTANIILVEFSGDEFSMDSKCRDRQRRPASFRGARFQRGVPAFLPASQRPSEGPARQPDMSPGMATRHARMCARFRPDTARKNGWAMSRRHIRTPRRQGDQSLVWGQITRRRTGGFHV